MMWQLSNKNSNYSFFFNILKVKFGNLKFDKFLLKISKNIEWEKKFWIIFKRISSCACQLKILKYVI